MGACTGFFGIGYMTWVQWSSIRLHTRGRPRVTKYFRPRTPTFSWYAAPSWADEEGQRSCLPWLSLFDFAGRIVRYRLLPCPKALLSLSLGIWCNTLAPWVQCTAQTVAKIGSMLRTSFYKAAVITTVFWVSCCHSHLTALPSKHWPIADAARAVSQNATHHATTSVRFFS
jgi:hypothetical protein